MHPAYFTVRFRVPDIPQWPDQFAIITAYATTGEQWTLEKNRDADARLAAWLAHHGVWHHRITGYAPDTGHAEPGFAVALEFDAACALGMDFAQDAIYMVQGDALFVTYCDERRALIAVGSLRERLDASGHPRDELR